MFNVGSFGTALAPTPIFVATERDWFGFKNAKIDVPIEYCGPSVLFGELIE